MSTIKTLVVLSLCAALVASANVARREEEEEQQEQQEQQEGWEEEPEDVEGELYLCGSPVSKNTCDFYSQYPAPVYVDEVEETEDQEKVEGYWTNTRKSKYMCQAVTVGECTVIGKWLLGEWKFLAYGIDTWNMYDMAGNEATVPTTYTTLNEETGAYKTVVFNSYAQCEQWVECNIQDEANEEDGQEQEDMDVKEECVPGYSGDEDDNECNQEGQGQDNEDRNEQNMWEQPEEDEKELEKKAECNIARYIKQTTTTYDEPVGSILFSEINTCHSGLTGEFTFTAEGDRYTGELEASGDIALCSNFRCSRQLNIINDSAEHVSTKAPRSTTKKTSVSTDLESTSSQMGAGAGAAVGVAVTLVAVFVGAAIAYKKGAFAGITNRQYEVITEH